MLTQLRNITLVILACLCGCNADRESANQPKPADNVTTQSTPPTIMHLIEGSWELTSGQLDGFEHSCFKGTRLGLLEGKLEVWSELDAHYGHSFVVEDDTNPPELHCIEGGATYSVWIYKLDDTTLELEYVDPGEPGRPTWAGFEPSSTTVRKAVFRRIN